MKALIKKMKILICVLLLANIFSCSQKDKVIKITDARNGKVVVIKRDECFKISGNPHTITTLPLKPEVIGAVLSQYDSFIDKAMKDRGKNPNADLFLMSLHDAQSRGYA